MATLVETGASSSQAGRIESLNLEPVAVGVVDEEVIDAYALVMTRLVIDGGSRRSQPRMDAVHLVGDERRDDSRSLPITEVFAEANVSARADPVYPTKTLVDHHLEAERSGVEAVGGFNVGHRKKSDQVAEIAHSNC